MIEPGYGAHSGVVVIVVAVAVMSEGSNGGGETVGDAHGGGGDGGGSSGGGLMPNTCIISLSTSCIVQPVSVLSTDVTSSKSMAVRDLLAVVSDSSAVLQSSIHEEVDVVSSSAFDKTGAIILINDLQEVAGIIVALSDML